MGYRAMPLQCCCGEEPEQVLEIGFTSDGNLIIHYWCSACQRVMFTSLSPAECHDYCPRQDGYSEMASEDDLLFLQALGISTS